MARVNQDIGYSYSRFQQYRPFINMPAYPAGDPATSFSQTCREKERPDRTGSEAFADTLFTGHSEPVGFGELAMELVEDLLPLDDIHPFFCVFYILCKL